MFYTYVLESKSDHKLYIGHTNNLKRRLKQHLGKKVPATKDRFPLKLVYYEACLNIDKAVQREHYFKTGFGRLFLNNRI